MDLVAAQRIEVGSIVRFEAPGSRDAEGQTRVIPAVVIGQWPNGSLQLYALHFEGSFLVNAIPLEAVELVWSRIESDAVIESLQQRVTELENQVTVLAGEKQFTKPGLKFSLADDSH
jgi:hypothetical protein